jgi:hypothetical protein
VTFTTDVHLVGAPDRPAEPAMAVRIPCG